jgi:serine/threonine-protein kinase
VPTEDRSSSHASAEQPPAGVELRSVPAADTARMGLLARRLIAANARLNAIALVTVATFVMLGAWVYAGVKGSLQDIRAAGLQTVLEAEANALQLWVENRKTHVEQWSKDERVRRYAAALVALARGGGSNEALWSAPARAALNATLDPVLRGSGAVSFNVVDTNGRLVATQRREYIGRRISPGSFLGQLYEVFKGRVEFIRPHLEKDRVEGAPAVAPARPVVWVEAPIADERGQVIAALGFSYPADGEFARILSVARPGQTGETYAFDEDGLMLSESRFVAELRKAGLAPEGAGAVLRVQARDPGGDLAAGHKPDVDWAALPLTRLAALAVASRGKPDAAERLGVVLEPYRNYRGVEVIGAWKWLSDLDMALAIEVAASEAYAPLGYLNAAFSVILALIAMALAAVLWSAINVRRLRREAGDARVLGQYAIEKEIGEGGMAKVYLARHALLKRPVALKMLKRHLASDEIVARFEREVQLASQLAHPNTIQIYDYGRTRDGTFYYVMEHLEGETLDKLVEARGAMPVGLALHILKQVCAALQEAHGRGLVHRDIKPHNIMLCQRGGERDVVKILDFGLVKDVHGRQSRDITQFQRMIGTPLYMAPERMRNPADADARSDVYSVGAVAFYLLTARDLFESAGEHDLTYHILHTPARRLADLVPGISRRLDDLVARCLAKDRAERPHDILVVLALLEAVAVEYPWTPRDAENWWTRRKGGTRGGVS